MKVLMIGGTGYLGYFSVWELVRLGHQVIAMGLPPAPEPGYLPDGVKLILQNIDTLPDEEVLGLLEGCDAVVYAGGADGRNSFPRPAITGYRQANVEPIRRLIPLMQQANNKKLVILGSYYTALDRTFPLLGIAERHPYAKSRLEQNQVAFELAKNSLTVAILELPYIFGAAPNRGTLWGAYVKQIQEQENMLVPCGGTACVTARQVGWAVAAACERAEGHKHHAIVEDNLTYKQIYQLFADALALKRTFEPMNLQTLLISAQKRAEQIESSSLVGGYDPIGMAEMQAVLLFLDPLPAKEALQYGEDSLAQAIRDTVEATQKYS
jgi:nucleoside-diphosphate-sugar epimerase